jgi:hypothetical protein
MTAGVTVTVIVYDLAQSNALTRFIGLGKYLATVEVYGTRVWAGPDGVETSEDPLDLPLRWTGVIGHTTKSRAEIAALVGDLKGRFKKELYDPIGNNANTFASEFCMKLCGREIPQWVNVLYDLFAALHFYPTLRLLKPVQGRNITA